MDKFGTLLAMLFFSYCLGIGNAAILPENFPKYHVSLNVIILFYFLVPDPRYLCLLKNIH